MPFPGQINLTFVNGRPGVNYISHQNCASCKDFFLLVLFIRYVGRCLGGSNRRIGEVHEIQSRQTLPSSSLSN